MKLAWTRPLFPWECLDDDPDLKTIELFFRILPDAKLLEALGQARGRGRDGYPVTVLWGVVVLTVLLRHTAFAQTLAELRRNPSLRRLIGTDSADDVPHDWNITRFLKVLGTEPFLTLAREAFDEMVRRLAEAVPDLAEHGIRPLIQMRALWKDETERLLPGHDGTSNVVYDEAGTIYCYDKVSDPPVRQRMAYIGYEADRKTVKCRCPAMHGGWHCPSHERCNAGLKYGKTQRIDCTLDLRRFPPIPRATKEFERLYKGRTAVERVNGRLKVFWGADDANVTGPPRFHAHVAVLMLVHVGLATLLAMAPRQTGVLGQTRLTAVARALREKLGLGSG